MTYFDKIKFIHFLILLESLFISHSISYVEGLDLIGWIAGGLYFLLSLNRSRNVQVLLVIYAIILLVPRILLFREHTITQKIQNVQYVKAIQKDCTLIPEWNNKEIIKCQEFNSNELLQERQSLEKAKLQASNFNLKDWSMLFVVMVVSIVLPLSIFFISIETKQEEILRIKKEQEEIRKNKFESFQELHSNHTPKNSILESLGISESTYYNYLNRLGIK